MKFCVLWHGIHHFQYFINLNSFCFCKFFPVFCVASKEVCLINYTGKTWECDGIDACILYLALGGGKWSDSRPSTPTSYGKRRLCESQSQPGHYRNHHYQFSVVQLISLVTRLTAVTGPMWDVTYKKEQLVSNICAIPCTSSFFEVVWWPLRCQLNFHFYTGSLLRYWGSFCKHLTQLYNRSSLTTWAWSYNLSVDQFHVWQQENNGLTCRRNSGGVCGHGLSTGRHFIAPATESACG